MVGLGPAGPELLTTEVLGAIEATPPERRFLRTRRHPAADALGPGATAFDGIYDRAPSLEEVYPAIVAALAEAAATADGPLLYAVPGSPLVAERTVELLRSGGAGEGVGITILPALSFLDLAWARLGVDPMAAGVRLVDGHRFAAEAAGSAGPLLVAQCDAPPVLSDIKLSLSSFDSAPTVTVLQRLGLPDERVFTLAWAELDHLSALVPDHLTSVWVPTLADPVGAELVRLAELIRVLRVKCPWDRAQTHQSLAPHLLEESYETVEAIGELTPAGEGVEHLEEELGDVLLQVVLHATIAAEEGWFSLADVARGIHDKMVDRHPHVFGPAGPAGSGAATADAVQASWDERKAAEREALGRPSSVLDGVSGHLPSLSYAARLQERAAGVGFDWPSFDGALAKVVEELDELRSELGEPRRAGDGAARQEEQEELGDLLFACVNVARHLGIDPEVSLRLAAAKFADRFRGVERRAAGGLADLDLAAMDAIWEDVKREKGDRPAR